MLLTIRNLPSVTRYSDVKNLIQTHCDLTNVILDNLVADGINKMVTVGVADNVDASVIRRNLNGFVLAGNKLKVEEMRSNKGSPHKQQEHSSSSKSSRWAPSIPSLLDTNTAPRLNPMLSQNTSSMANIPMMGQHTSLLGFGTAMMGLNTPMMNQNTLMMGQNSSMMGQHSPMMDQGLSQNMPMSRQSQSRSDRNGSLRGHSSITNQNSSQMGSKTSMNQFSPFMGPINPLMGQNPSMMGNNQPAMVPPPLMGNTSFSAPFYMTPQSNIYGNHTSGQQMASQLSDFSGQKGMQSRNSEYPDSRHRKNVSDKSVWDSSADDSNYRNKRHSGASERDRDRHDRGSSGSRRTKWDAPRDYEAEGSRYKSQSSSKRVVKPWANDDAPYNRSEYGQFDRSHDRELDRYSRRQEQAPAYSGSNAYQNRSSSGGGRDSGSHYRGPSPPGHRRGPPRDNYRERDRFSPPAKRVKPNQPDHKQGPPAKKNNVPPKAPESSMKKIIHRDVVWRSQAAAALVLEMFKTIKTDDSVQQNVAYNKMKLAVRNRLLIILNNRISVKISDQSLLYRRKFKPDEDQHLYDRIVRHIKRQTERPNNIQSSEPVTDSVKTEKNATEAVVKQPVKPVPKPAAANKPQPTQNQPGVIPKYPQGNKALHQKQKKNFQEEFKTSGPTADLDDVTKKVVEEEMDRIKEVMLSECTADPADDAQKFFCEKIKKQERIFEEAIKMMTLNLAKRILKVGSVPVIRVIGNPKPPKKAPLVEFLKDKGVTSLKKSVRKPLYIVTCDSYESFDNLCALNDVVIDDIKVSFKPMYLTPPPDKVRHKKGQKQVHKRGAQQEHDAELGALEEIPMDEVTALKEEANVELKSIKEETVSPIKNKETKLIEQSDIKKQDAQEDYTTELFTEDRKGTVQCKDDYDFTQDVDETPATRPAAGDSDDVTKLGKFEGDATEIGDYDVVEQDDEGDFEVNEDDLEDY